MKVRLCFISDTHAKHRRVEIPVCDILCHSGDFTNRGQEEEVQDLHDWFEDLISDGTVKHVVVIAGNHEMTFDSVRSDSYNETIRDIFNNSKVVNYLEDSSLKLLGLKFYGSPWQPEFCNWAFNKPRGEDLVEIWQYIPLDTDILLTHGPCYGIGDFIPFGVRLSPEEVTDPTDDARFSLRRLGCEDLMARVRKMNRLKVHAFGHIHFGYGRYNEKGERDVNGHFINASTCSEEYDAVNSPLVVDLENGAVS